jgi:hypothetical protein
MNDSIICPECGKPIPLTQAITHQIKEQYERERKAEQDRFEKEKAQEREAFEREKKEVEEKTAAHFRKRWVEEMAKKEEEARKAEEERKAQDAEREKALREKVAREMELKFNDTKNEAEELQKQNKSLQEQILETNKLLRQMRAEKEQAALDLEKKLAETQEKIREEEQKRLEEQHRLRVLEQEKRLNDALKVNEELKRKLEQGSQQSQGEVLEIELEQMLRAEFVTDQIEEVPKGISGADLIQTVNDRYGKKCGTIVWEFKRTKAWSEGWVSKLKNDQRQIKAEIAVIVTQALPDGVKRSTLRDGVWVCEYESIIGMAYALRAQLQEVHIVKQSAAGKTGKMEILYDYLTGTEFKQRVEAIVEHFSEMQHDLEVEKRWMAKKWAKQEKNIRRVIDNTVGMHGDLQGIVGKALGEIKGMELLDDGIDDAVEQPLLEG